jgi:hypothetical protein
LGCLPRRFSVNLDRRLTKAASCCCPLHR